VIAAAHVKAPWRRRLVAWWRTAWRRPLALESALPPRSLADGLMVLGRFGVSVAQAHAAFERMSTLGRTLRQPPPRTAIPGPGERQSR
jgi:hypothetical protein